MKGRFSVPAGLTLAFLFAGDASAQQGTYLSKFNRLTGFAGFPTYSTDTASTYKGGGFDFPLTVTASFTEKSSVALGLSPGFVATFAQPMEVTVGVTVKGKAPFSDDKNKDFNAQLFVNAYDPWVSSKVPLTGCSEASEKVTKKTGQEATIVAGFRCTVSRLVWFNHTVDDSSSAEIAIRAELVADGGGSAADLEAYYKNTRNWDEITYSPDQPRSVIATGTSQAFSGNAYFILGTRDDAFLVYGLFDSSLSPRSPGGTRPPPLHLRPYPPVVDSPPTTSSCRAESPAPPSR